MNELNERGNMETEALLKINNQNKEVNLVEHNYGEMELEGFDTYRDIRIKYIKVNKWNSLQDLYKQLIEVWKIPKPELIISINGGAKNMIPLSNEQRSAFKRGLVNVSKVASTWIITGGFNVGVSKLVGEAARDYNIASQNRSFTILGIGTWGAVYNRQDLVLKESSQKIIYKNGPIPFREKGQAPLDPNHDVFILFDSGKECVFGDEIEFRPKFESFLADQAKCIVVEVVVEGGKRTFTTAKMSLDNGIPLVILKGSKRVADFMCEIIESEENMTENIIESGLNRYEKEWRLKDEKDKIERDDLRSKLLLLKEFKKQNLIHIFSMSDFTKHLDKAILEAAFSATQKNSTDKEKLKMSIIFNRLDVAEKYIFQSREGSGNRSYNTEYEEFFEMALLKNKWQFVRLFISKGAQLKNVLNLELLEKIYFENEKTQHRRKKNLFEIGLKISKFTKNMVNIPYPKSTRKKSQLENTVEKTKLNTGSIELNEIICTNVQNEDKSISEQRDKDIPGKYTTKDLFLWALLLQRWEMAKVLWENGNDHIGSALIACAICSSMSKIANKDGEIETETAMLKKRDEFESLAINILNEAYSCDRSKAHLLLSRVLSNWGTVTCMGIANKYKLINFLSQTACQTRLDHIWRGGMSASLKLFILNLPLGFLTSKLIIFKNTKNIIHTPENKIDFENNALQDNTEDKQKDSEENKRIEDKKSYDKEINYLNDHHDNKDDEQKDSEENKRTEDKEINYLKALETFKPRNASRVSFRRAVFVYYKAPLTKFIMHIISYVLFLTIYSYMCLVELLPLSSVTTISQRQMEYVVYIYIVSFVLEEIRQAFSGSERDTVKESLMVWISSWWNRFDLIIYSVFSIAVVLRHITSIDFVYARTLYSTALSLFFLRFLQFYYANRLLGPKVISVSRMIKDVMFFLCLFIIAILTYGTFAHALLYSNSSIDGYLLKNIVYMPFWQSFADLHIEYVEGTVPLNNVNATPNAIVIVGFAVFILFTNILLMNMLIAMFGMTIRKVEDNSNKLWAFNRYKLINEFYFRPVLPPPLNFIEIFISGIKYLVFRQGLLRNNKFALNLDFKGNLLCAAFEQYCLESFLINNPLFKLFEENDQISSIEDNQRTEKYTK